jgi:hypothetical protein
MNPRRGAVLVTVVFALVLLAALATTAAFLALQEWRTGRNRSGALRARESAHAHTARVVAEWHPATLRGLEPGDSIVLGEVVARLTGRSLLALEARGEEAASGAERRLRLWARLDPPPLPDAPLALAVPPTSPLTSSVTGADEDPPGWTCDGNKTDATASLQLYDTIITDGGWSWGRLHAWGARGWVVDSFRLVYSRGDLSISGERVTGVVVVGGDLVLSGRAELLGAVLVRGSLRLEGLGGAIFGVVIADRLEFGDQTHADALRIRFSRCAAERATLALAPLVPLSRRPRTLMW